MQADPHPEDAFSYRHELGRKALHLLALVVPLGIAWLGRAASLALLVPGSMLALTGDVLRVRHAPTRAFLHRVFGRLMRPEEVPPMGGPVHVNGATWVLLSATLLVLVFPVPIAVPAFTMFMVADAAAALVGGRFGRRHWGSTRRTVEGSLAFAVTAVLVLLPFPQVPPAAALVAGMVGAAAEAMPRPFNDNVRVPFIAAAVLWILGV